MATNKNRPLANFLGFLGSLIYLYVTFTLVSGGAAGSWVSGAGAVWLPLLGGLATLCSVIVFITALASITGRTSRNVVGMMRTAAIYGGLALFALTGPSGPLGAGVPYLWVLAAFVLVFLSSEMGHWS